MVKREDFGGRKRESTIGRRGEQKEKEPGKGKAA